MTIIPQKFRKEIRLALIVSLFLIAGSITGILPLSAITGSWSGVYSIQWAGIECAPTGVPGPSYSISAFHENSIGGCSRSYYATDDYVCPYIGGCTVEATNMRYANSACGGPGSSSVTIENGKAVDSKPFVSYSSSNLCCYTNALISANIKIYPTNLYILKKTSGPATIQQGWLTNTKNCWLHQASPELIAKLDQSNDLGSFTTSDGTKIDPYRSNVQVLPGETVNYMVNWVLQSTRTVDYNGQKALCVPREGIYKITPTGDSDTYVQGDLIKGNEGGTVCCGEDQEGVCGYGFHCDNFRCVEGSTGGDCDPSVPYISKGTCLLKNGTYTRVQPSKCVGGSVIPGAENVVECCPNLINAGCDSGFYCGEDYACHKEVGKLRPGAGQCSGVAGETTTGAVRTAFDSNQYEKTPCAGENKCCYDATTSSVGVCLASCAAVEYSPIPPTPGETCSTKWNGFGKLLSELFGGCGWLEVIFFIILLTIVLAVIFIIIRFARKK